MVSGFRTSSVLLCGARNRSADSSIRSCANTLSAHFSSGRLRAESAAGSSSTPSLALRPLRPRTQPLRQLVEHVRHLVAPVALRRRLRPHVPHRRPEAERAVAPRRRRRPAGTARRPASRAGRRPPPTGAATGPRGRPTARSRDRRTSASATNPSSARKNRHWRILPAAAANLRVGLRLRSVSLSTNRPGWMWIPPCRCCVFSTCRRLRLPRRVRRTDPSQWVMPNANYAGWNYSPLDLQPAGSDQRRQRRAAHDGVDDAARHPDAVTEAPRGEAREVPTW